ncbi:serine/arginine repetitive matrix protein 3-like isoform X2 [Carassius carassius]|uniref:serine/arginine repetitive matrix protein 3-like isoform X2 n=1 Tax=Carassius carassius TaxID=217509 RepID=UPI00286903F4|nr:serine/arginine repetitive matrix protein 3-like isoform X2 [Carassius carassius]
MFSTARGGQLPTPRQKHSRPPQNRFSRPYLPQSAVAMYDGARVPSPEDAANRVPLQPETPAATHPKTNEEPEEKEAVPPEPVLVKKAHREILDHERKRRVELKCMELQEMMEEEGYSEEEIRQKVGTFRQMLMEKEGVITREGLHPRTPVRLLPHGDEDHVENAAYIDGYEEDYDWDGEYYKQGSTAYDECRSKRISSSSPSPRPKKRKKKKARRHSRADSPSPTRRDKRKKSGKKHKRDRSTSGSKRKRRHRSGSHKNKHKDKNKQKKRCSVESPSRSSQHRGSCCSSRSGSVSSTTSVSKSPSRSNAKCRNDRHKQEGSHSSHSPPPSLSADQPITWQNGNHSVRVRNGKDSGANHTEGNKGNDLRSLAPSPSSVQMHVSPHLRCAKPHVDRPKSPGGPAVQAGEDGCTDDSKPLSESMRRHGGRPRVREINSPAHSSDTESHTKTKNQKKRKGSHSSKRLHRGRGQKRHRSSSMSLGRHRHTSKKKKSKSHGTSRQRSSSWSSGRSSTRAHSREHRSSKNKSPHVRQNNSRERDSPNHSDAARSRRHSRSYSPIRKRRRDSPSFMEARRITSARKRPIPYYRPSPSSSSSASSYSSSSRSCSRSYSSCSSSSRSRSRSPSPAHSYYSRSSSDSPGF